MIYDCQIWEQHKTTLAKRVMKLQQKAIRIAKFKDNNAQMSNLFAQSEILKFNETLSKYKPCQKLNRKKWC